MPLKTKLSYLAVTLLFLGFNATANSLSQGGNGVANNSTLNGCAGTQVGFTVSFTTNGAKKSDSLRIYQGNTLLTAIVSPTNSFNLSFPGAGSNQQYSAAFYEIGQSGAKDSVAFTLSAYSNASISIGAGSQRVCFNTSATGTITATPQNGSGNYTYRWLSANNASMTGANAISGETATSLNLANLGTFTGGSDIYIKAEVTDVDCGGTSLSNNTYQIITDDQLGISIAAGSTNVCFGAAPSGTVNSVISGGSSSSPNYSYTWYEANNSGMTGKSAIAGQSSATLSLSALGVQNGGADIYVQVEVTESNCGETASSSQTYQIITHEDLSVSMASGSQEVCYNNSANGSLSLSVSGGQQPANYTYRWYQANNASMTGATIIAGQSSSSLNLSVLGTQLGGNDIYIQGEATDASCSITKTTANTYQIITHDQLTVSIPSGQSQEVCYNATPTGTISLSAGGGSSASNYNYSWWRANNSSMSNAIQIAGQTSTNINLSVLGTQLGGDDIYIQARLNDGACSQTVSSSSTYHIITDDQLTVGIPTASVDICYGATPSGTVNASVNGGRITPNFTYTWYQANNSAMTGKTAIAGQSGASLNLSVLGQYNGGADVFLQVEVNESNCSETATSSETYQLITHEDLVATMPTGSQEVCYNTSATGVLSLSVSAGQQPSNYSYRWLQSSNSSMTGATVISNATSSTLDLSTLGNLLGGNDVYIQGEATDVNCGTVKTTTNLYHLITHDQLTVNIPAFLTEEVCYNHTPSSSVNLLASGGSSSTNYVYSWYQADNSAMNNAVQIAGQSGSTLQLSVLGTLLGGADVYVQARVFDSSCNQNASSSNTFHVITRDQLQISVPTTSFDICYGTTPSGTVTATITGGAQPINHSYVWYEANNSSMTGKTLIAGQTGSSINLNTFGVLNGGADKFIQAEVTDNTCSQTATSSQVFQLITHEDLQVTMPAGSQEVCYNDIPTGTLQMTASAGRQPANYTYRWLQANNPAMTGATAISGQTSSSLNLNVLGALLGGADVYIKGEATDVFCSDVLTTSSTYHIITWDQLQAPSISNAGGTSTTARVCYNDPLAFDLEMSYSGGDTNNSYTYTWEFSSNASFSSIDSNLVRQNATMLSAADIGIFTDTVYIRCVVSDNCNDNATSPTFTVNVWDELDASLARFNSSSSTATDLCFGQLLSDDLVVDYQGGDLNGNFDFRWQRASDVNFNNIVTNFPLSSSPSLLSADIDTLQSSSYFRCIVYDACGDSSISPSFNVLVYPEFLAGDLSTSYQGNQNDVMRICFGEDIDIIRTQAATGADPATYSYFLEFKALNDPVSAYQDLSLNATTANSITLDSALVLLSPGAYSIRQRIEANCNPVFTDPVTVLVNEPPYWGPFIGANGDYKELKFQPLDPDLDDNNGNLNLCEGSKNVLLKLNQEEVRNYNYQWSSGSNLNPVLGARTIVSWNVNSNNPLSLDMDVTDFAKNCDRNYTMNPNDIAAGSSPDDDQLTAVNSILVDADPDVTANYFKWGRINKNSLAWEYTSNWDTARFFDYGTIDTTTYVYVMAAADAQGSNCRSYSYYPANFWLNPSKATIGIEEPLALQPIEVYPNPNNGVFQLKMDDREVVESIQAFDLMGQSIPLDWDPDLKRVQLRHSVKSYIVLQVQSQNQVASFKILVQ